MSGLIAAGSFAALRLLIPEGMAAFAALPFLVIAIYAGVQQLRRPGAKRVAATLERARGLSGESFISSLEEGFRRDGYAVTRRDGGADLVLTARGLDDAGGVQALEGDARGDRAAARVRRRHA